MPEPPLRQVVVTGARGAVADAVLRRLRTRDDIVVTAVRRGDDVADHVTRADVVIVLDQATSARVTRDYRDALAAVVEGRSNGPPAPVVTVTPIPERRHDIEAFKAAEAQLVDANLPLTVIRSGLVIGEPDQPGPFDDVLVGDGGTVRVHGADTICVRPILIDDLARLTVQAMDIDPLHGYETVVAAGPAMSVTDLLRLTRPDATIRGTVLSSGITRFVAIVLNIIIIALAVRVAMGGSVVPTAPLVGAVATFVVVAMLQPSYGLPRRTPEIDEGEPQRPLRLRAVEAVWSTTGHEQRRARPKRSRRARSYAVAGAVRWIACLLGLWGAAVAFVGAYDLATTFGLAAKLVALSLLLSGLTTLGGAIGLGFPRWRSRYAFGVLAALLAFITLSLIWISALLGHGEFAVQLFAPYLLFVIGACALVLWARGGLALMDFMKTRGLKITGSVLVGGTIAAVLQIVYSTIYVPTTVRPAMAAEVVSKAGAVRTVGRGSAARRRSPIAVTVTLRNVSSQPLVVLSAPYAVYASRRVPARPDRPPPRAQSRAYGRRMLALASRHDAYSRSVRRTVAQTGSLLPHGEVMEPGQTVLRHLHLMLAPGWTDAALRGDVALVRRNFEDTRSWETASTTVAGVRVTDATAAIEDRSLLHRATRAQRYFHVQSADGRPLPCAGDPPTALHVTVDRSEVGSRSDWCVKRGFTERHYGLTYWSFVDELELGAKGGTVPP